MYNSLALSQEQGSKGSTRLHMDMADAFNVMVYAADCEDGTPGYAVWNLFRAEDGDKIRAFLRKRFTPGSVAMNATVNCQTLSPAEKAATLQLQAIALHDPIHSQHFYLDVELRKELWEQYSVKSYRIYQRPGEGVFIPANHQLGAAWKQDRQ
jgi:lysine-specific demethylase 3